jgi:hypothetical protein
MHKYKANGGITYNDRLLSYKSHPESKEDEIPAEQYPFGGRGKLWMEIMYGKKAGLADRNLNDEFRSISNLVIQR